MAGWDPDTYLQFADERGRPFYDLVARIAHPAPATVVDLGCGPGQLTAGLTHRWPDASVIGIDSSAEMIATARAHASNHDAGHISHDEATGRLCFTQGDVTQWTPDRPVDVIVSNATLQWVPGHRELLPHLVHSLTAGGSLAFQVPGNFGEPSHRLLHELAEDARFADATRGVERPSAHDAAVYLADLVGLGCSVDAWETTYLHVLTGPDPVFRWISGTGARPVFQALEGPAHDSFVTEYKALLREAYPDRGFGTILPFRRVFVVATKDA